MLIQMSVSFVANNCIIATMPSNRHIVATSRAHPVARRAPINIRDVTEVTVQVKLRRHAKPVVLTELHRGAARNWVASHLQQNDVEPELTTTQAATLLGVSRPHLIGMIEDGILSCHTVGTHRRLQRTDVLRLRAEWEQRRPALAAMTDAGHEIDT